jgi:hypothetical protein
MQLMDEILVISKGKEEQKQLSEKTNAVTKMLKKINSGTLNR